MQDFVVASHRLKLRASIGPCVVQHEVGADTSHVVLGLEGPCYFIPWRTAPATHSDPAATSDGLPIGTTGDARAYAYGNGVTAVLVIGNPIPPDQAQRAAGYRCAGGSQAVLLQGNSARASKRKLDATSRINCVEWGGPDEREYWLFAHDG